MVAIDMHTHIVKEGCRPDEFTLASPATPENLIRDMDEAEIDKSVVLPIDHGLDPGVSKPKVSIEDYNKWVADAADQYSDRLIAFVGVDPRRKNAVEILEKGVQEWGMKGLKLYPPCGFYPNDKVVDPLWAKANELGIPVLLHSGPTWPLLNMKYGQPIYLEDVLVRYPRLNIVIAHLGGGMWTEEVIGLRTFRENVYSDISGWQMVLWGDRKYGVPRFVWVSNAMRGKLLFGSDWPLFGVGTTHKQWVDTIKGLEEIPLRFRENLLGNNAAKLLKL